MFFAEPTKAFTHIGEALRDQARFALLTWQPPERNEWICAFTSALLGRQEPPPVGPGPGPFSMSDPGTVHDLLTQAGFREVSVRPVTGPMTFGSDVERAHRFVSGLLAWMVHDRDPREQRRALDALHTTMTRHCTSDGVAFDSAAWLITATWRG